MGAEEQQVRVVGAARLAHGETMRFSYETDDETVEGFVLRYDDGPIDALVAYRNWCPHIGTDLDMGSGRFYSKKVGRIYCHTHGARFQPMTGQCDFGPCVGLHREPYALVLDGDDALVTVPGRARDREG